MFEVLVPVILAVVAASQQDDPAAMQLPNFKKTTKGPIGILTTAAGAPVDYTDATNTINSELLDNEHLIDIHTDVIHQTIPERVVHAPGAGAFGYFETTHDISHICKAKLFSKVGKRTPVAVRFSLGFSSKGVRDTLRESRGYAVKFYTEEGNYDFTTLNQPIFAFKDPVLFQSFVHVLKRNPASNLPDHNMAWDFVSSHPEALNQFTRIFSHHGMPRGYRKMRGFGIHTMQVYNATGHSKMVRFYGLPKGGAEYYNATETAALASEDPDLFARDLYNAIENGNYPCWEFSMQIIPECDVNNPKKSIFDVTYELPFEEYPLHPIGKFCLNKNPLNNFADIEQIAFSPGNLVPGILGSPDKIFQIRRFGYRESANHRLGTNFKRIAVNLPIYSHTYNRDGVAPVGDNGKNEPNYYPNSFNGIIPYVEKNRPTAMTVHEMSEPRNLKQVANFYSKVLNSVQKSELIENLVEHLSSCDESIKKRVVKLYTKIHSELGRRLGKGLANYSSK